MKSRLLLPMVLALLASLCGELAAADYPENEQAMYGGAVTPSDKPMLFASGQAVFFGWRYLSDGDEAAAMRRFNQAWYLNPRNAEALWGMGVIAARRSKTDEPGAALLESIRLLTEANALSPRTPRLMGDLAFSYMLLGRFLEETDRGGQEQYDKAGALFEASLELEPDYSLTLANYAVFKFYMKDYPAAQEYVQKAEELGYPVGAEFKRKLAEQL